MNSRVGIDLGGTKILGVVMEADGTLSKLLRAPTPRDDYAGTCDALVRLIDELDPAGDRRVGIGTPGTWLAAEGRMQNCNSTWLNGQPLGQDLQRRLGPRVRLANDADCFALSEASSGGAAEGWPLVFGAILGTGVGGGIVAGGRLLAGPNGLTGEWGHTPLPYPESRFKPRRCYCGRLDCIETYLCGSGLIRTHHELWPEEADAPLDAAALYLRAGPSGDWAGESLDDDLTDLVSNGQEQGRAIVTLRLYCRMLARCLGQIVNMVDPHAIVLGGGLSNMHAIYEPVTKMMRQYVFGEVFETRVLPPRWGDASGVRGAAWLWEAEQGV